jgi:hypothetical protein
MAVAYDSSASGAENSGSWSHTCSGSNRVLIVVLYIYGTGLTPAVTYGGVSMTLLQEAGSTYHSFLVYILFDPPTGTNTISFSVSSTHYRGVSASYKGVSSVNEPNYMGSSTFAGATADTYMGFMSTWGDPYYADSITIAMAATYCASNDGSIVTGINDDTAHTYVRQNVTFNTASQCLQICDDAVYNGWMSPSNVRFRFNAVQLIESNHWGLTLYPAPISKSNFFAFFN